MTQSAAAEGDNNVAVVDLVLGSMGAAVSVVNVGGRLRFLLLFAATSATGGRFDVVDDVSGRAVERCFIFGGGANVAVDGSERLVVGWW